MNLRCGDRLHIDDQSQIVQKTRLLTPNKLLDMLYVRLVVPVSALIEYMMYIINKYCTEPEDVDFVTISWPKHTIKAITCSMKGLPDAWTPDQVTGLHNDGPT